MIMMWYNKLKYPYRTQIRYNNRSINWPVSTASSCQNMNSCTEWLDQNCSSRMWHPHNILVETHSSHDGTTWHINYLHRRNQVPGIWFRRAADRHLFLLVFGDIFEAV